jgi:hypothetical protein
MPIKYVDTSDYEPIEYVDTSDYEPLSKNQQLVQQKKAELNRIYGQIPKADEGKMSWSQTIGEALRAPFFGAEGVVGSLATTVADVIPDKWGLSADEWLAKKGLELRAESQAFDERARESGQYMGFANPASTATEFAAYAATPAKVGGLPATALGKAGAYGLAGAATSYPMFRTDVDSTAGDAARKALVAGATSAIVGPVLEKAVKFLGRGLSPEYLPDDYRQLPKDIRKSFERLSEEGATDAQELYKRARGVLGETTLPATEKAKNQLVKIATETGDPVTRKRLFQAIQNENPKIGGNVLREATMRTDAVLNSADDALGQIVREAMEEVDGVRVTDWRKVYERAQELPNWNPNSDIAHRLRAYTTLDDPYVARTIMGRQPSIKSGDIIDFQASGNVGYTESRGVLDWIKDKFNIALNPSRKILKQIGETAGDGPLTPRQLEAVLTDAGVSAPRAAVIVNQAKEEGIVNPVKEEEAIVNRAESTIDDLNKPVMRDAMRQRTGKMSLWKDAYDANNPNVTGEDLVNYVAKYNDMTLKEAEQVVKNVLGDVIKGEGKIGEDLTFDINEVINRLRKGGLGDSATLSDFLNLNTSKPSLFK